jgi:stage II sporulation protein P
LIIDLHRDGGPKANAVTAVINNEKYARPMFVIGQKNPNKAANIALAQKLNNTFEKYYKGFVRGITYKANGKYHQDLSPNCVLLEVGSENSSIQEAINSTKIIAKVISENVK